jgi:hypothetical protein
MAATIEPPVLIAGGGPVGRPFEFELRGVQHWHHRQSVARAFRSKTGNVFLAGDAAHLFAPTGGVGMNTGIGGAIDLDWFGRDWVLVRARAAPESSKLDAAFAVRGMRLATKTLPTPELETRYERPLVLVRPDGHVA